MALSLSDLILKGFWEKFVESCEATGGRGAGEEAGAQSTSPPHLAGSGGVHFQLSYWPRGTP